jgi:hypothetical protein
MKGNWAQYERHKCRRTSWHREHLSSFTSETFLQERSPREEPLAVDNLFEHLFCCPFRWRRGGVYLVSRCGSGEASTCAGDDADCGVARSGERGPRASSSRRPSASLSHCSEPTAVDNSQCGKENDTDSAGCALRKDAEVEGALRRPPRVHRSRAA